MRPAIGIDPGLEGALVLIRDSCEVLFRETPIFKAAKGRKEYNLPGMLDVLRELRALAPEATTWLEHVQAFPKNGSIGNFKLGRGSGLWEMALVASNASHELVRPQRWKGAVLDGAPKTPQGEAAVAARLYPHAARELVGPKGGLRQGRVDALLIAHFGARRIS